MRIGATVQARFIVDRGKWGSCMEVAGEKCLPVGFECSLVGPNRKGGGGRLKSKSAENGGIILYSKYVEKID